MQIFLILLKIIGILLLFFVCLVGLVLLAAVRYSFSLKAEEGSAPACQIKVNWLLVVLFLNISYIDNVFDYRLKLFGYQVLGNQAEFLKKKEEKRKRNEEKQERKEEKRKEKEKLREQKEEVEKTKEEPQEQKEEVQETKEEPREQKEEVEKTKEEPQEQKEEVEKTKEEPQEQKEEVEKTKEEPQEQKEEVQETKEEPQEQKEEVEKTKEELQEQKEEVQETKEEPREQKSLEKSEALGLQQVSEKVAREEMGILKKEKQKKEKSKKEKSKKEKSKKEKSKKERKEVAESKISGIYDLWEKWKEVNQDYAVRELLAFGKDCIFRMGRHVLPQKLNGFVRFGFDDPATTGMVTGGIALFYPKYQKNLVVSPDFTTTCFAGSLSGKGRMRPGYFFYMILHILWNSDVRRLLKKVWKSR